MNFNYLKKTMLVLVMIFMASVASAADREEQYWSSIKFKSDFGENMNMLGELLNRYSADSERFVTRSVRMGLQYNFESDWSYALIFENRTASSDSSDEARYINQFSKKFKFEKLNLGTRGRWEFREFSNSKSFSNRIRARLKLDGVGYKFYGFTPFSLAEYFYAANEVPGRPEGATELRLQAGVSFQAIGGKVSISYLDRTTNKPEYQGQPKSESRYGIIDLGLSWSH